MVDDYFHGQGVGSIVRVTLLGLVPSQAANSLWYDNIMKGGKRAQQFRVPLFPQECLRLHPCGRVIV